MTTVREPLLRTVAILDLRPTQMTVGMREVKAKRKRWRDESKEKGDEFLGKHMIPVILGPKHRHYIIDHAIRTLGPVNTVVPIFEQLLDSRSVFLTANDNTVYSWMTICVAGRHRRNRASLTNKPLPARFTVRCSHRR